jgi:hypothetical protein
MLESIEYDEYDSDVVYWNKEIRPDQIHSANELAAIIKDPRLWPDDRINLMGLFNGLGIDVDNPAATGMFDCIIPECLLADFLQENWLYLATFGEFPLEFEPWVVVDWEATARQISDDWCSKYRYRGNWYYFLRQSDQPFMKPATTETLEA